MPSPPTPDPPIIKPALSPPSDPAHGAALIFLHGLGDSASGVEDISTQFQRASKLPYLRWIFPNAPENLDALQQAWYTPTGLSPFPPSRPELEDDEDAEGMKASMQYIVSLIDEQVSKGIPENRIVLAGFSQGCAMTLLTGLTSKYSGRLAGLAGLMGYLPLPEKIQTMRAEGGLPAEVGAVPLFFARGTSDRMVPRRYYSAALEKLKELGLKEDHVEAREYEGMGHTTGGVVLRDLCTWLEKVIPPLE